VALITQSSNIALNMTMQRRGLPIAYVATAGNQAQTGLDTIAEGFLEDKRVTAIGLHIEGIDDVPQFEAMALRARELRKPVIALTVGRSAEARAATISHTASVAGSEAGMWAFFTRTGIPRVTSIPAFLETLKLLHVHGPLPGNDLLSMSCSGGEASVMADAAVGRKLRYRAFTPEETARVKGTLSNLVTVANPLDYHTFIWGREEALETTFSAAIGCGFDLSMLVLDFPRADRCRDASWEPTMRAVVTAAKRTGGRVAVVASLPENMPEHRALELMDAGVAPLCGIEEAITAAEAAAFIGDAWRKPALERILIVPPSCREGWVSEGADHPSPLWGGAGGGGGNAGLNGRTPLTQPVHREAQDRRPSPHKGERVAAHYPRLLDEAEAKARLAEFGVPIPKGSTVTGATEAATAAAAIGYPVALKARGVAHKTEAGALRLNLMNEREVLQAAEALAAHGSGLLLEEMVTDAVAELLVGVTRDPQFGLLLTIGAGGVLVELLGDAASLLLPATEDDIRVALLSLRTAPVLQGYRGRPVGDLDVTVAAILAVARFAEAHADSLDELDVNPLLVRPRGRGAIAVDALVRIRENR
jgi:acyl-CoA synthetase (NDP forming)